MKYVRNLRIGVRLGGAFAIILCAMIVSGMLSMRSLGVVQQGSQTIFNDRVVPLKQLKQIADAYAVSVIDTVNKANAGRLTAEQAVSNLSQVNVVVAKAWKSYRATALTPEEAKLASEAEGLLGVADTSVGRARAALEKMSGTVKDQLNAFDGPLYETVDPISDKIGQLVDLQLRVAGEVNDASLDQYRVSRAVMLWMLCGAVAMSALLAWWVTKSITEPIGHAVTFVQDVRDGDLTKTPDVGGRDEISALLQAMLEMQAALSRIVCGVRGGVDSVTTASSEIAAGNHDLSSRTEWQASSLQETASSMEQLTGSVQQSAGNARQASDLAAAASEAAARGGAMVGRIVGTMNEITHSSHKIADITGVIDAIAFQTNILALNAAVEAARAGDQGRGFAVVAGEVRMLAQRSAQAAKEITALIGNSVDKVENGSREVDEAGQAMEEIVAQVIKVSSLINEIAAAAQEQSSGISQVNQAVAQMDEVTQHNAALVEESAAAAGSLAQQAKTLGESVAVFRLALRP